MFCDGCGAVLPADQRFCSRCGKEVRGTTAIGSPRPGRVQEHLRLLAILWLALSAVNLIGGVVLVILANTLFVHLPEMGGASAASGFLRPLLNCGRHLRAGEGRPGICSRMGIARTPNLGAHSLPGSRIHFAVQHSSGHCAGNLHTLGASPG